MPSNLYYFDPCCAGAHVCRLGKGYHTVAIPREGVTLPVWEFPAVLVLEPGKDDLLLLQKAAPKTDLWRIICLAGDESAVPARMDSRIFAVLPARCVLCDFGQDRGKGL